MTSLFSASSRVYYTPWSAPDVIRDLRRTSGLTNPKRAFPGNRDALTQIDARTGAFRIGLVGGSTLLWPLELLTIVGRICPDRAGAMLHVQVVASQRGLFVMLPLSVLFNWVWLSFVASVLGVGHLIPDGLGLPVWLLGLLALLGIMLRIQLRETREAMASDRAGRYLAKRLSATDVSARERTRPARNPAVGRNRGMPADRDSRAS